MKIELKNFPEVIEATSRGVAVTMSLNKVPEEHLEALLTEALAYGLRKPIIDAASDAKRYAKEHGLSVEEATRELMLKKAEVLQRGQWTARGAGSGVTGELLSLCRDMVKGADPAAYKDATEAERRAMARAWFEAQDSGVQKTLVAKAEAMAEAKAKLAEQLAAIKAGVQV